MGSLTKYIPVSIHEQNLLCEEQSYRMYRIFLKNSEPEDLLYSHFIFMYDDTTQE